MRIFYSVILIVCALQSYAQELQPNVLDEFTSRNGSIITIEDYTVPRLILQLSYGDARVRKITGDGKTKTYYQVTSGDFTGSVPADEFPALMSAYENLKGQAVLDVKPSAVALTRQYKDSRGFELGYTVEGKKITWFIKQYRNCLRILHVKDPASLEESLTQASAKLKDLK